MNYYIEIFLQYPILYLGFGWLTINVFGASFVNGFCDYWSLCELFVKVLIDNKEVCRTDFERDKQSVDFFKTCLTNKIRKTATIKFELWDKDVNHDDVLDRWEKTVDEAVESGNFNVYSSFIRINAFWKDEHREHRK